MQGAFFVTKEIIIYTDGACSGNPGPGGWGAILRYNGHKKEIYGSQKDTTNNRMELTAVIEALSTLKEPCKVVLYTDSKYIIDGITQWIDGWKAKGWKTANKKHVKNDDLWKKLDELCNGHDINWQWVKGHDGNPGNERADELACKGADEAK